MLPTGSQKAFAALIGLFFVQRFAEAVLSRFATPGADAVLDVSAAYVAWAAAALLAHRYLLFPRNLCCCPNKARARKPSSCSCVSVLHQQPLLGDRTVIRRFPVVNRNFATGSDRIAPVRGTSAMRDFRAIGHAGVQCKAVAIPCSGLRTRRLHQEALR